MAENSNVNTEPTDSHLDTTKAHRLMVLCLFVSTLAIGLTYLALGLWFSNDGRAAEIVTPLTSTIIAGAGGGFVSSLRRLYAFNDVFPRKAYERLFQGMNFYVMAYSSVPALVGMIGAVIVYLVFAAGLLADTFNALAVIAGVGAMLFIVGAFLVLRFRGISAEYA